MSMMERMRIFISFLLFVCFTLFGVAPSYAQTASPSASITLSPTAIPTPTHGPVTSYTLKMIEACFGVLETQPSCTDKSAADLNGDGVIDGIDYNLYLIAVRATITPTISKTVTLTQIPTFTITPTPTAVILQNTSPSPLPSSQPVQSAPKSPFGLRFFLIIAAILTGVGAVALFLSSRFQKKNILPPATASKPPVPTPSVVQPTAKPVPDQPIQRSFFIKPIKLNSNAQTVELSLVDDNNQFTGIYHYQGKEVKEGFANIKGILKTENGRKYIVISDLFYIS